MRFFLPGFAFLIVSSLSYSQWTQTNGPEGTSVTSLATINGTIYAGTRTDGVYLSTDDGLSWVARNSGIESFEIDGIAGIPGYLFAATFGHGVYRSTDNGQTWLAPSTGTNLSSTGLVVKDSSIFVSSVNDGVYRSTDNGLTWVKKLFGFSYITAIGVSGNRIFASTDSYYTLVSYDNGESWTYLNSVPGFNHWCYYTEGNLVLIGGENEVYRSTDQGNTFTTLPLNINYGLVNVYAVYKTGSILLAGTSYDGVYKSTDNGINWVPATVGMGPKDIRALTSSSLSTVIAGSNYAGIYRSTNSGTSWNKSMAGIPPGSSILSMLNSSFGILAGTRDGLYASTDNGSSWTKFTGNSDTVNYSAVRGICENNGVLYAGMFYKFNSTVYKSPDHGITWLRSGSGLPPDLTFIFDLVSSGNNIVAATDEGIYYSSDQGNSWQLSVLPAAIVRDLSTTGNYVYGIVDGYGIYQSADNGVSWYAVYFPADYICMASKDNYAYSGTFFDGAVYTSNNGSSWNFCSGFPSGQAIFAFEPVSDGFVLAATSVNGTRIYASTDYGADFYPYSEGLGPNAIAEHFCHNNTFAFAGMDYNGIWRRLLPGVTPVELLSFSAEVLGDNVTLKWRTSTETNNKGFEIERSQKSKVKSQKEWEVIGFVEGHGTTTQEKSYSYIDRNLEPGKYSYRLLQRNFDGTGTESEVIDVVLNEQPNAYTLKQNYPNPFNPTTTISYSIPKSGNVQIKVFNSIGEQVSNLVDEFKNPGNYEVTFDAAALPSGIYYYSISAGSFTSVKKMILLK